MSQLTKYIDSQNKVILDNENQIMELQQALEDSKQKLKLEKVLLKGREIALSEIKTNYNSLTSLLRDICSVLPIESLDLIKEELVEIIDSTKQEYERYSQSDRFLNIETKSVEDADLNLFSQKVSLPATDDTKTLLTAKQLESIISELAEDVLEELKGIYEIDGRIKKLDSLAISFSEKQITMVQLKDDIATVQQLLTIKKRKRLGSQTTLL